MGKKCLKRTLFFVKIVKWFEEAESILAIITMAELGKCTVENANSEEAS